MMLSRNGTLIVLVVFIVVGIVAVWLSIMILRRGKLHQRIKPEARPRRWVLILLFALFAVFLIWFPVWMIWPHASVSRFLGLPFGIVFASFALASRFPSLIDSYVERKG